MQYHLNFPYQNSFHSRICYLRDEPSSNFQRDAFRDLSRGLAPYHIKFPNTPLKSSGGCVDWTKHLAHCEILCSCFLMHAFSSKCCNDILLFLFCSYCNIKIWFKPPQKFQLRTIPVICHSGNLKLIFRRLFSY